MTTHSFKHKILLDENFTARSKLPLLNQRFDVKHVSHDYKHDGWSDKVIDQKLTALFRKATQKSLLGKLTIITGETEI